VFDGLGGTAQGALAARLAAAAIRGAFAHHTAGADGAADRAFLALAVQGAGALIGTHIEDGLTTASVVHVRATDSGTPTAHIANVGDSRIHRSTPSGELLQCTLDDSIFGSDWEIQLQLSEAVAPTGQLERAYFAYRHVMDRALGDPLTTPRLWDVALDDGDVVLAATDGVTDNLTFSELRQLLAGGPGARSDPTAIARRVVEAAYARSQDQNHPRAKTDDITAVAAIIHLSRGDDSPAGTDV
jgi:serine/threonine protein phosphatase PrpC